MEKRIPITPGERDSLRGYLAAVDAARRDVGVAAGMILVREGINEPMATLERVDETEIVFTLPDAPQLALVPDEPAAAAAAARSD